MCVRPFVCACVGLCVWGVSLCVCDWWSVCVCVVWIVPCGCVIECVFAVLIDCVCA